MPFACLRLPNCLPCGEPSPRRPAPPGPPRPPNPPPRPPNPPLPPRPPTPPGPPPPGPPAPPPNPGAFCACAPNSSRPPPNGNGWPGPESACAFGDRPWLKLPEIRNVSLLFCAPPADDPDGAADGALDGDWFAFTSL